LVSFLDEKGRPSVVERSFILPPASRIGPLSAQERQAIIRASLVYGVYEKVIDRESAYEKLQQTSAATASKVPAHGAPAFAPEPQSSGGGLLGGLGGLLGGSTGPRGGHRDGAAEILAKSAARAIGSQVGRQIIRGVLGSILGGKR
jgi:DNA helicase HerA-like ATPase